MRLFIAITFDEKIRRKLLQTQTGLKEHSLRGNFTRYDNLHLTLVFLGEVAPGRVDLIRKAMDRAASAPFGLCIKGVGCFRRDRGAILWAGIERNKALTELHGQLRAQIVLAGFPVEERQFKPHLTLAREARLRDGFDMDAFSRGMEPIHTEVSKISLMKSERIDGRLTYTEIYHAMGRPGDLL